MDINYFFPVFKQDDIKTYLKNFKTSAFFKKYTKFSFVFVCEKSDEKNIKQIKEEIKTNKQNKLITLNKPFSYNDAFYNAIKFLNADVVLLGDTNVVRIDAVFEKCMQKYDKKINVVHIVKRQVKFKGFIFNMFHSFYNFFVKLFTNKLDRLNVISLGLIDKSVIEVLKELPNKCCFLKNTKNLLGFETRTIYIPPNTNTFHLNYKKPTLSLILSIVSLGLSLGFIIAVILLNCFIKTNALVYNIIGVLLVVISLSTASILIPKHIFDIRNYENREEVFEVEEVKTK